MLVDEHLQPEPVPFVKKLLPCKNACHCLGSLLLSLRYLPTVGTIEVIVMKADRLPVQVGCTGRSGLIVKVNMLYSMKKVEKKRTEIVGCCPDPVWNQHMTFDVPFTQKRDILLVFELKHVHKTLPTTSLGKVVIGQKAKGSPLNHWSDVLHSPRKAIAMWHSIIKK